MSARARGKPCSLVQAPVNGMSARAGGKRRLRQAGRGSLSRAQERQAWKRPKAFSLSRPRPGAGRHNRGRRNDVHRSRSSPCGRGPPAVAMHRLLSRSHVPATWSVSPRLPCVRLLPSPSLSACAVRAHSRWKAVHSGLLSISGRGDTKKGRPFGRPFCS